jgi:hypothetical protein
MGLPPSVSNRVFARIGAHAAGDLQRSLATLAGLFVVSLAGACAAHSTPPARPAPRETVRRLRLDPVSTQELWFADELAPLEDAIAAAVQRSQPGSYDVVPYHELRELWSSVQQGHLPGRQVTCPAPPAPDVLASVLYPPEVAVGSPRVRCQGAECSVELDVVAYDRDEPRALAQFRTTVPAQGGPSAWAASLAQHGFARATPRPDQGGLGIGGVSGGVERLGLHARMRDVVYSDNWTQPPREAQFQKVAAELEACQLAAPARRDFWMHPTMIAVNAQGKVVRCEPRYLHRLPEPGFACKCDVLRSMDFGPGADGRRASFELEALRSEPRGSVVRYGHMGGVTSADPWVTLGEDGVKDELIGPCLEGIAPPLELKLPVHLSVDADGKVTAVQATFPEQLSGGTVACLEHVLGSAQLSCPAQDHAEVDTSLTLHVMVVQR